MSQATTGSTVPALTAKQRTFLKAQAHHLRPVVQVGKGGISDELVQQVGERLDQLELIKLRVNDNSDEDRGSAAAALRARIRDMAHVATIGRVLILFRPAKDRPTRFPLR